MVNYEEALKAPLVPLVPIFPTVPGHVPTNLTSQLITCPDQTCGQYLSIKLEMQSIFCHKCKKNFRRDGVYWVPTTPEIAAAVQPSEKLPCPRCLQQLEIKVGVEKFGCPKCNAIYKREGMRYVGQLDPKTGGVQQQPGAYQQQGQQGQYLRQQQYQPQPQQQYQPQQYQQLQQQQYQPQPPQQYQPQQYQQLLQPHAGHGANSSAAAQLLSGAMGGNWNYAQHSSADAQHSIVNGTGSAPPANSGYSTVNVPCSDMSCQKQHTVTRGTSKFNCLNPNCNTESTIIKCSADNCQTLLTVDCSLSDHFQCPSCNNEMYLDEPSIAQWWQ